MKILYAMFCFCVCSSLTLANAAGWSAFASKSKFVPAGPHPGGGGRSATHIFFHK